MYIYIHFFLCVPFSKPLAIHHSSLFSLAFESCISICIAASSYNKCHKFSFFTRTCHIVQYHSIRFGFSCVCLQLQVPENPDAKWEEKRVRKVLKSCKKQFTDRATQESYTCVLSTFCFLFSTFLCMLSKTIITIPGIVSR